MQLDELAHDFVQFIEGWRGASVVHSVESLMGQSFLVCDIIFLLLQVLIVRVGEELLSNGKFAIKAKIGGVLRLRLSMVLPCCVSSGAVVAQLGQASVMSERNEGTAAAGLALVVVLAKSAIATVEVAPDLAG